MTSQEPVPTASAAVTLIEAAGTRIAIHRAGKGPPVVCLHATGHSGRDFDELGKRLGGSFEFIALDWPGQGESPRETALASATRYAETLARVVDALSLNQFVLIGNSVGGAAAITYAATNAARVRGMVLCNSGGLFAVNWLVRWYCRILAQRFARGARGEKSFGGWFERYYRGVLPMPAARWRRKEIVASGYKVAEVLRQAWESFAAPAADIRHLVPSLTMPVLYAWGRRDKALPWSLAKKAALRAPRASVALFDGGHAAFLEQPAEFDAAFVSFARSLPN